MPSLHLVWGWIVAHWQWIGISTVGGALAAVGGLLMWFPHYRKAKADADIAEHEREKIKRDEFDQSVVQAVLLYADGARKLNPHTAELVFSEDDMRESMPPEYAARLHAGLELLREKGRARKSPVPGFWFID